MLSLDCSVLQAVDASKGDQVCLRTLFLLSQIEAVQVDDDRVMGVKRTRKLDAQRSALIKRIMHEQARATIEAATASVGPELQ